MFEFEEFKSGRLLHYTKKKKKKIKVGKYI